MFSRKMFLFFWVDICIVVMFCRVMLWIVLFLLSVSGIVRVNCGSVLFLIEVSEKIECFEDSVCFVV